MPLEIPRIKALCFDVDGTLSDTDDLYVQKLSRILHPLRGLFPGKNVTRFARRCVMASETPANYVYKLADQLHLDDDLFRLLSQRSDKKQKHTANYTVIPGIIECLNHLGSIYPMSVVSARDEKTTLAFLDYYNLRSQFVTIVTSQTCEYTKPFPDPVIYAAKQMGVAAENCLMIGDTTVDIHAGRRAGSQTAGVLCGFGDEKELHRAGADVILETTCQINSLLLSNY